MFGFRIIMADGYHVQNHAFQTATAHHLRKPIPANVDTKRSGYHALGFGRITLKSAASMPLSTLK